MSRPDHPGASRGSGARGARRGITLIEMTACLLMLGVAMGMVVPMVGRVATHRRQVERRMTAFHEANNRLEELAAAGPGAWVEKEASAKNLSSEAVEELPGGALRVDVGRDGDLTRLSVVVSWEDRPGIAARPVELTTWVAGSPEAGGEARP